MSDSLYQKISQLVADLKAEHAELTKDGVLSWSEAVKLIVHAGREVASLVNGVTGLRPADRKTVLRDAAEQVFDQVIAPVLYAKLQSKWWLRMASAWIIPAVKSFAMQTATAAFDAIANIVEVEDGPDLGVVGLTAKEVQFGKAA